MLRLILDYDFMLLSQRLFCLNSRPDFQKVLIMFHSIRNTLHIFCFLFYEKLLQLEPQKLMLQAFSRYYMDSPFILDASNYLYSVLVTIVNMWRIIFQQFLFNSLEIGQFKAYFQFTCFIHYTIHTQKISLKIWNWFKRSFGIPVGVESQYNCNRNCFVTTNALKLRCNYIACLL